MAKWDLFISHASEDKKAVALPLKELLEKRGLSVWLDKSELRVGDALTETIESALGQSRFGVVVLSKAFFAKSWPKKELRSLLSKEGKRKKMVLPVLHGIDHDYAARFAPALGDRLSVSWAAGPVAVANEIQRAIPPLRLTERSNSSTIPELRLESRAGSLAVDYLFLNHTSSLITDESILARLRKKTGENGPYYRVEVFLDSYFEEALDEVERVEYYLHESYPERLYTKSQKEKSFRLVEAAYGESFVGAKVFLQGREDSPLVLQRYLNLYG